MNFKCQATYGAALCHTVPIAKSEHAPSWPHKRAGEDCHLLSPTKVCGTVDVWSYRELIPQTVLALRGSYFFSIVIALEIAKAGRQVPKPRCLSPAAHSLEIRIAGRHPKYLSLKYLSPAANSLEIRIAGRQPKFLSLKHLSPAVNSLEIRIAGRHPKYLSLKYLSPAANSPEIYISRFSTHRFIDLTRFNSI
jgi:hypothetical protein